MIPKIIHQIWIGDDEPPEDFRSAMESVKRLHPDYVYMLHGNECINEYNLEAYYNKMPHAFLSDLIRFNKINEHGGWYIDADMVALQSINNIPNEIHESDFGVLYMDDYKGDSIPVNGLFCASKDFDLSGLISGYKPVSPGMNNMRWFAKRTQHVMIPKELCSVNGTILKDLLKNTWGKQFRHLIEVENHNIYK